MALVVKIDCVQHNVMKIFIKRTRGKKELNQADINLAFQAGQTEQCILCLYFIHAASFPSPNLRLKYTNE